MPRRVVLIGWDAADWQVINPLLDSGEMPGLQSIVENGVRGDVASLAPMISPLLWTSIATGHLASAHGVLSFHEPDPVSGTVRLVSAASRKVKALWNILTQSGLNSIVLNWFASQPAEPIRGAVVSNLYPHVRGPFGTPWPLPNGSVHPERLREVLADLRVHPAELSAGDLLPFIPLLARIDQSEDSRPQRLATELAEALSVHCAATWLMENEPWDFFAVYFTSIDHLGRVFMPYHPPRMPHVPERDYELYKDVIGGVYRYQDMLLRRMMQLAGPEATFIVVSDHGFQNGAARPTSASRQSLGWEEEWNANWHRSHGVFCAAGPGLRRDELVFGASLLDITPFVLTVFGLPAGEDMPGKIMPDAFEVPPEDRRIPSWEAVPGEGGELPKEEPVEAWESAEALAQLADLGYIETLADDRAKSTADIAAHADYVLARVYLESGKLDDATPLLERSIAVRPVAEMRLALAHCYFLAGRRAEARRLVDGVLAENRTRPYALVIQANLELAEGRPEEALALLKQAQTMPSPDGRLQYRAGLAYQAMGRWAEAESAFARAIEADADFAMAHRDRARALLGLSRSEEAADEALQAVNLRFDDAESHFYLGTALAQMRQFDRAAQALETSLRFLPSVAAHKWLAAIYSATGNREKEQYHRQCARALKSGL